MNPEKSGQWWHHSQNPTKKAQIRVGLGTHSQGSGTYSQGLGTHSLNSCKIWERITNFKLDLETPKIENGAFY